jgi:hypothetical protein
MNKGVHFEDQVTDKVSSDFYVIKH